MTGFTLLFNDNNNNTFLTCHDSCCDFDDLCWKEKLNNYQKTTVITHTTQGIDTLHNEIIFKCWFQDEVWQSVLAKIWHNHLEETLSSSGSQDSTTVFNTDLVVKYNTFFALEDHVQMQITV